MGKTADTTVAGIAWGDKPVIHMMVPVLLALLNSMGLNATKVWPQVKLLCFALDIIDCTFLWLSYITFETFPINLALCFLKCGF